MSKRFIITILTVVALGVLAGIAIFFAKGYSFSTKERRILGTGIVTISSEPDAASVLVDGHLTTATNATISSLPAKTYHIKVVKEGFIPWEKSVEVKEGLVKELKVTLFPAIPTIYPLTFTGVSNPVLSPDGSKLTYIVSSASSKKNGIWVWTLSKNQPIAFARSAQPHQIASNIIADFSKAALRWSADSKQVLATVGNNNYLLDSDNLNSEPKDITPTLSSILSGWEEDTKAKNQASILAIKDVNLRKIASDSALVRWSPDETKLMVADSNTGNSSTRENEQTSKPVNDETELNFKVYDLEDERDYDIPAAKLHWWLPDSRHIILVEEGTISLIEFEGTNKAVIYAGKFDDSLVFPWPDSSRLAIVSSLPTPTASEPNLYGINLR